MSRGHACWLQGLARPSVSQLKVSRLLRVACLAPVCPGRCQRASCPCLLQTINTVNKHLEVVSVQAQQYWVLVTDVNQDLWTGEP